ncbi:MAG: GNAT family N-acetyltransferase [Tabrizicola sp.]|nr:GNAT family N-acetyltransferase [Tabrizicola sp.]
MTAPHEIPIPGPAADFAEKLTGMLPEIETARLRLRAVRLVDFDAWAEILTGPAAPHIGGPFSRDEAFVEFAAATGMWLLRGFGPWAVELRESGDLLGFVLIGFEPGDHEAELGYLFRPKAEGQGFATEAAAAARDHVFAALKLDRLASYVAPENTPSIRVAERLGASLEGTLSGCGIWVHRPVARDGVSPRAETEGRRKEDAMKTSTRGA